jgi:hypothetical protein
MTRRKGEITRVQLRQWWPHHVVLSADKVKGLRNSTTVHEFANTLSVAPRTYWLRRDDADHVVFASPSRRTRRRFASGSAGKAAAWRPGRWPQHLSTGYWLRLLARINVSNHPTQHFPQRLDNRACCRRPVRSIKPSNCHGPVDVMPGHDLVMPDRRARDRDCLQDAMLARLA